MEPLSLCNAIILEEGWLPKNQLCYKSYTISHLSCLPCDTLRHSRKLPPASGYLLLDFPVSRLWTNFILLITT